MALAVTVAVMRIQDRNATPKGSASCLPPRPFGLLFRTLSAAASLMGVAVVRIGSEDLWPFRHRISIVHFSFRIRD